MNIQKKLFGIVLQPTENGVFILSKLDFKLASPPVANNFGKLSAE